MAVARKVRSDSKGLHGARAKSDILEFFPAKLTPREGQRDILLQIQAHYNDADVFVITAPTACGKTNLALTLQKWAYAIHKHKVVYALPNNLLLDQVTESTGLFSLRKKSSYRCNAYRPEVPLKDANCETRKACTGEHCSQCPYISAVRKSHSLPHIAVNTWTYLAHKLFKPVLIIDEAHTLIQMLQDMNAKKIWKFQYKYPSWVQDYGSLLKWTESHPDLQKDKKLQLLQKELSEGRKQYLVAKGMEYYRGGERECLKMLPIDTSQCAPILYPPGKVKKIFLLSGTINHKDVEQLALAGRRVLHLEVASPIPVERRPVHYVPIANMSLASQPFSIPKIAEFILQTMDRHPEKGMVHAPYALAKKLRAVLTHPRIMFHDETNKTEIFDKWRSSPVSEGKVLVGSGMEAGIDLAGPDYTFQIVSKVPYPSLSEPAIRFKAEDDPSFYGWQTIKLLVQAAGRISRTPSDFGATYILDSSFERLYQNHKELFPRYFKEALVGIE